MAVYSLSYNWFYLYLYFYTFFIMLLYHSFSLCLFIILPHYASSVSSFAMPLFYILMFMPLCLTSSIMPPGLWIYASLYSFSYMTLCLSIFLQLYDFMPLYIPSVLCYYASLYSFSVIILCLSICPTPLKQLYTKFFL